MSSFIRSDISGDEITNTKNYRSTFAKKIENWSGEAERFGCDYNQGFSVSGNWRQSKWSIWSTQKIDFQNKMWLIMDLSLRRTNTVSWGNGN